MVSVDTSVSNANHQNCHDMASIFVYLLLPVAGLIIVWLRKDWITKIFVRIGGFYLQIPFSTFGKEKLLLNWARKRLPSHWSTKLNTLADGISDFWKDGSLLCTLINSAVPGACPNPYRHWRKPPEHAQEVALKYLGVMPVFNNSELTSSVSPYIDAKLLKYLNVIRKSIYDLEKERLVCSLISSEFLARGMGLYTAEQFKPSEIFVYSKSEQGNFLNIEILIFGPYCTCIRTTVSDYIIKKGDKDRSNVSKNINIEIEIEIEKSRVRICYTTNNIGMHEIILSCNQESIRGSPFYVNVEKYDSFNKEISLKKFEAETEKLVRCNYIENETDIKNSEIDSERKKSTSTSPDESRNNYQKVNFQKVSHNYKENIFNETIKDNKISNKVNISDNKVATKINKDKSEILEISKYLKNLSNTHEKEVNINKNIATNIAKENYSEFQKLVDSSYRNSCRITRANPRLGQTKFAQFSYASPVCSDHIAPEDSRKLCLDSKRRMFSQKKSVAIDSDDTPMNSQFSIDENKTEELKEVSPKRSHNEKLLKVFSNLNEFKKPTKDNERQSLHRIVKEKRVFWESAFDESNNKIQPNLTGDAEPLDKNLSKDLERNNKYVKSLDKLRKRVFSQSFNDLHTIVQKRYLRPFRSLDDNLDMCCKLSLEDRTKSYFENIRFVTGKELKEGTGAKMFVLGKYARAIFREERKIIR